VSASGLERRALAIHEERGQLLDLLAVGARDVHSTTDVVDRARIGHLSGEGCASLALGIVLKSGTGSSSCGGDGRSNIPSGVCVR
jgi:hypothetical protein